MFVFAGLDRGMGYKELTIHFVTSVLQNVTLICYCVFINKQIMLHCNS